MFNHIRSPLIASFIALVLLAGAPSLTIARSFGSNSQDKESRDKKDKKDDKDDKDKPTKSEREYQKIRQFSEEQYAKDPGFRDEVEEAYRQKQREHSDYAYRINTRDEEDAKRLRNGDKLKVEDTLTLYDNPLVQDYVNRVGQSLVPKTTNHLFAFRVILNPIPEARSLSTGTVYVSSGLISQIDNEAQLSYVLSHEIGHIEKGHWHEDALVAQGMERYNEKQQKKRSLIGAVAAVATGGLVKSGGGTFGEGALMALLVAPTLLKFMVPNATVAWDKMQEDEADRLGLQYMLERNYDPREVPKFYASLKRTSQRDRRVGLGFMADPNRVAERAQQVDLLVGGLSSMISTRALSVGASNLNSASQQQAMAASALPQQTAAEPGKQLDPSRDAEKRGREAEKMIGGKLAADIQAKLDAGEIIGSSAEFEAVMAELKRDNGIRAFYYDMFQMARDNLQESLMIRSNDPQAHLYYGKVLKLTARNAVEKSRAMAEFVRAIELDKRNVLPESHLHRALAMIERKDPSQTTDIVTSLKQYVGLYQREHGGALPPNMDVIYDYMQEAGEVLWAARPATNVSTKNIEPITTATRP